MIPNVLTLAGVDPSGGAGIFADLKTFSALGAYGTGIVVALTAQNTQGVTGVQLVPAAFVTQQIDTLFADVRIDAAKVGMLANAELVSTVASGLRRHGVKRLVVDPVMVSKSGHHLLQPDAVEALRRELLPLAEIVTPNLPEAGVLLGRAEPRTIAEMRIAARDLHKLGPRFVLLKGGHLNGAESTDILDDGTTQIELRTPRIATKNTHGTGCTLSAAITALLPQRATTADAVRDAKTWLTAAIAAADQLTIGHGHGPVHHFHALWPKA
ncbi:MAG: bifunctional hydroxymethylpyrimidine kinase/phosphomethylpyrimidine kinase [Verrucomicrobia bacterium]|nr:bifunctional hydroxymethylpyrimidine kinase/phosphomethylpyrimidine kinase [Verrucomicrobiota bacterium]